MDIKKLLSVFAAVGVYGYPRSQTATPTLTARAESGEDDGPTANMTLPGFNSTSGAGANSTNSTGVPTNATVVYIDHGLLEPSTNQNGTSSLAYKSSISESSYRNAFFRWFYNLDSVIDAEAIKRDVKALAQSYADSRIQYYAELSANDSVGVLALQSPSIPLYLNLSNAPADVYRDLPKLFDKLYDQQLISGSSIKPALVNNSYVPTEYQPYYENIDPADRDVNSSTLVQGIVSESIGTKATFAYEEDKHQLTLLEGDQASAQTYVEDMARVLFSPNVTSFEQMYSLKFNESLASQFFKLISTVNRDNTGSIFGPRFNYSETVPGYRAGRGYFLPEIPNWQTAKRAQPNILQLAYDQSPDSFQRNATGWGAFEILDSNLATTLPNGTTYDVVEAERQAEYFAREMVHQVEFWLTELEEPLRKMAFQVRHDPVAAQFYSRILFDGIAIAVTASIGAAVERYRKKHGGIKANYLLGAFAIQIGAEAMGALGYAGLNTPWAGFWGGMISASVLQFVYARINKTIPMLLGAPLTAAGLPILLNDIETGNWAELGRKIAASLTAKILLDYTAKPALYALFKKYSPIFAEGWRITHVDNRQTVTGFFIESAIQKNIISPKFEPAIYVPQLIRNVLSFPYYDRDMLNTARANRAYLGDMLTSPTEREREVGAELIQHPFQLPSDMTKLWKWKEEDLFGNAEKGIPPNRDLQRSAAAIEQVGDLSEGVLANSVRRWLPDGISVGYFQWFEWQAQMRALAAYIEHQANPTNQDKERAYESAKQVYRAILAVSRASQLITGNPRDSKRGFALETYSKDPEGFTKWYGEVLTRASKNASFLISCGSGLEAVGQCYAAFARAFDDLQSLQNQALMEDGVMSLCEGLEWKRTKYIQHVLENLAFVKNELLDSNQHIHVIDRYFRHVGIGKFDLDISVDNEASGARYDSYLQPEDIEGAARTVTALLTGDIENVNTELERMRVEVLIKLNNEAEKYNAQIQNLDPHAVNYETEKKKLEAKATRIAIRTGAINRVAFDTPEAFYTKDSAIQKALAHAFPLMFKEITQRKADRVSELMKERDKLYAAESKAVEEHEAEFLEHRQLPVLVALEENDPPHEQAAFTVKKIINSTYRSASGDDETVDEKIAGMERKLQAALNGSYDSLATTAEGADDETIEDIQYRRVQREFKSLKPQDVERATALYETFNQDCKNWLNNNRKYKKWKENDAGEKVEQVRERYRTDLENIELTIADLQGDYREFLPVIKIYEEFRALIKEKLKPVKPNQEYEWNLIAEQEAGVDLSHLDDATRDILVADLKRQELLYAKKHGITTIKLRDTPKNTISDGGDMELQEIAPQSRVSLREKWIAVKLVGLNSVGFNATQDDIDLLKTVLQKTLDSLNEEAIDAHYSCEPGKTGVQLPNSTVVKVEPDGNTWIAAVNDEGTIKLYKTETRLCRPALSVGSVTPDDFTILGGPKVVISDVEDYFGPRQLSTSHRLSDWQLVNTEQGKAHLQRQGRFLSEMAPSTAERKLLLGSDVRLEVNNELRNNNPSTVTVNGIARDPVELLGEMEAGERDMIPGFLTTQMHLRGIKKQSENNTITARSAGFLEEGAIETDPSLGFFSPHSDTPERWATSQNDHVMRGTLMYTFGSFVFVTHLKTNPQHIESLPLFHDYEVLMRGFDGQSGLTKVVSEANDGLRTAVPNISHLVDTDLSVDRVRKTARTIAKDEFKNPQKAAERRLKFNLSIVLGQKSPERVIEILTNPAYQISNGQQSTDVPARLGEALKTAIDSTVVDRMLQAISQYYQPMERSRLQQLRARIVQELNPIRRLYPTLYDTKYRSLTSRDQNNETKAIEKGRGFPLTLMQARVLFEGNLARVTDADTSARLMKYFEQELPFISKYVNVGGYSDGTFSRGTQERQPVSHKLLPLIYSFISSEPKDKQETTKKALEGMMDHLAKDLRRIRNVEIGADQLKLDKLRYSLIAEAAINRAPKFERFQELLAENDIHLKEHTDLNNLQRALEKAVKSSHPIDSIMRVIQPHIVRADRDISFSPNAISNWLQTQGVHFVRNGQTDRVHRALMQAKQDMHGPAGAGHIMRLIQPHLSSLDLNRLNEDLEHSWQQQRDNLLNRQLEHMTPLAKAMATQSLGSTSGPGMDLFNNAPNFRDQASEDAPLPHAVDQLLNWDLHGDTNEEVKEKVNALTQAIDSFARGTALNGYEAALNTNPKGRLLFDLARYGLTKENAKEMREALPSGQVLRIGEAKPGDSIRLPAFKTDKGLWAFYLKSSQALSTSDASREERPNFVIVNQEQVEAAGRNFSELDARIKSGKFVPFTIPAQLTNKKGKEVQRDASLATGNDIFPPPTNVQHNYVKTIEPVNPEELRLIKEKFDRDESDYQTQSKKLNDALEILGVEWGMESEKTFLKGQNDVYDRIRKQLEKPNQLTPGALTKIDDELTMLRSERDIHIKSKIVQLNRTAASALQHNVTQKLEKHGNALAELKEKLRMAPYVEIDFISQAVKSDSSIQNWLKEGAAAHSAQENEVNKFKIQLRSELSLEDLQSIDRVIDEQMQQCESKINETLENVSRRKLAHVKLALRDTTKARERLDSLSKRAVIKDDKNDSDASKSPPEVKDSGPPQPPRNAPLAAPAIPNVPINTTHSGAAPDPTNVAWAQWAQSASLGTRPPPLGQKRRGIYVDTLPNGNIRMAEWDSANNTVGPLFVIAPKHQYDLTEKLRRQGRACSDLQQGEVVSFTPVRNIVGTRNIQKQIGKARSH